MKSSKKLAAWIEEGRKSDNFWIEETKLDFALALEKQLKVSGLNYSALAKKIGTSPAYITKVFRGDSNLTIESMVKLTRATGGRLNILIRNNDLTAARNWERIPLNVLGRPQIVVSSTTDLQVYSDKSSNDGKRIKEAA